MMSEYRELIYNNDIKIKISGCMNACGHHHVGNIGVLGVDKKGEEFYQISLGGSAAGNNSEEASLGKILGPSFARERMADVIQTILDFYVEKRLDGESFLEAYRRIGHGAFKEAVYGPAD